MASTESSALTNGKLSTSSGPLILESVESEAQQIEGKDGEDLATDSDSADGLWDVDRDMSAEEVTAALAEEKRRKKVRTIME